MRNRILSITRSNIPYVKELHPLTGSVIGCLVMQQLDYWFTSQPDGFYKFLEPADHPAYKAGDSWVEELGMSADEFRYAFDRISIRYKSKREFDKASKDGDAFRGKFYCSYIDRRANLTYYYRNHDVVDAALDELINEAGSKTGKKIKTKRPTHQDGAEDHTEVPVTGNSDLQELEIPIPRSWNFRFTGTGNSDSLELEKPFSVNGLFPGPLLQRLHTETTTTTGAAELSTEPSENAHPVDLPPSGGCDDSENEKPKPEQSNLIWPICSTEERDALAGILKTIPASQRQILLDETEGARRAGSIRSGLVPFAGGLVRAMLAGTFTVSQAPAVAARRREQAAHREQVSVARSVPTISNDDLARGQAVLTKILGQTDVGPKHSTSSL